MAVTATTAISTLPTPVSPAGHRASAVGQASAGSGSCRWCAVGGAGGWRFEPQLVGLDRTCLADALDGARHVEAEPTGLAAFGARVEDRVLQAKYTVVAMHSGGSPTSFADMSRFGFSGTWLRVGPRVQVDVEAPAGTVVLAGIL